jgi:GntR family uxuAB operon transcriptional repressor
VVSELVDPADRVERDLSPAAVAALLVGELDAAMQSPSGRIAPERELAARFALTRAAVRRWLEDLERDGRVTRHVGRGTFVVSPAEPDLAPDSPPLDTSPAEIMTVRLLLEPQMLGLAVANATVSDIAEMRRCLAESEAAGSYEDFEVWDSRLHTAIAHSTHNRLLIQLFAVMNEARNHPLWGSAKRRSFTPERRAEYEGDHRDLVAAIDDRDNDQAATVMRRHLQRIRGALLGVDN